MNDNDDLEQLLQEERERYIDRESSLYALIDALGPARFRGLHPSLNEDWIERHLTACREYYEEHGTKFGDGSPWIEACGDMYD